MAESRGASAVAVGGWWGEGPPPSERWPGVTIPITDEGGRYRFDTARADRVCNFFPTYCSHGKGEFAGQRFNLLDYQTQLILRPLFGWVRVEDGFRRFRKAYIEIPKKNGKTQLIAGLALYMLLADGEPGAEVYVAAADRDQAKLLFKAAAAMVEANSALKKRLEVLQNEIRRKDDLQAIFKVLSREAATKHGPNIHCLILDELHAQPDRELFETLTRGVIARRQPLILLITTAGDDDESICAEEYEYAKRVLSGVNRDERHLPVIFEASKDEDFTQPAVWARVNPALGKTISVDAMQVFANEAANEPRKLNDFLRFHLNRWVNQASAWIPVDWWDACEPVPVPEYRTWLQAKTPELAVLPCAGGLDLAQKWDLACFNVVFRHRLEDDAVPQEIEAVTQDEAEQVVRVRLNLNYRVTTVPFFWIPEDTMREHEQKDGIPYTEWAKQGLVIPTAGPTIDYSRIYSDITTKILPMFPLLKQGGFGYDPAFATDIGRLLREKAGFGDKGAEVLQNYTHLSEVCYIAEALIKAGRVSHGGHRTLRNHVENSAVKVDDAKRMRPVKPKTGKASKHIDGLVAFLMALKVLSTVPDGRKKFRIFSMGGGHAPTPS